VSVGDTLSPSPSSWGEISVLLHDVSWEFSFAIKHPSTITKPAEVCRGCFLGFMHGSNYRVETTKLWGTRRPLDGLE